MNGKYNQIAKYEILAHYISPPPLYIQYNDKKIVKDSF